MPIYSIKNQKQFNIVNSCGKKITSPHFMLIVAKKIDLYETPSINSTFLGMKVSKKLSKKACIRNKIKRRIRHLVRLMYNENLDLAKTAIIFIPYKKFESVEFAQLLFELKRILGFKPKLA